MNIHVGDDDGGVETSSKRMKNERPPRDRREATKRCREES